jgi:hypothetical protein
MIRLQLSEGDAKALLKALKQHVSELRTEIAGTEQEHRRDALKTEEASLKKIIEKLGG